ncbi:MAG: permease [Candidatus Margulisbacteria bacterium GWF2_35_9]|nr:MAG: permease [Candidatus Margulisbacteria bacterium GWF2_35_9]
MLRIFTVLADYLTYDLFNMNANSHLAKSIHFFIEDTSKIFVLLVIMVYGIAVIRASINIETIRDYLSGKNRFIGYFLASIFGAITPFCSCSSIPLFLGFTQANIPIGITMSFLITSPMINEVAVLLLGSILGLKFMIIYVVIGMISGIVGGWFFDATKAEKHLLVFKQNDIQQRVAEKKQLSLKDRHEFAKYELQEIVGRVWKYIIIGVGLGALLHGYIPEEFISTYFHGRAWWNVPLVVLTGIPLYSNVNGVIPVAQSLINKGLPIGTAIAFMMSMSAASFPEFMMLKQVMKPRLLITFFILLLVLFTINGWVLNIIF